LKGFGFDFFEENTPGQSILSHIIFSKLPCAFRKELIHRVVSNYPTLDDIFANYNELLKTLISTKYKSVTVEKPEKDKESVKSKTYSNSQSKTEKPSALQNYKVNSSTKPKQYIDKNQSSTKTFVNKPCKFCSTSGHSMLKCDKFVDLDSRIKRCKDLNLCTKCTSTKHNDLSCPGKNNELDFECCQCKQKSHISALCSNSNTATKNDATVLNNLCA
jgi:uncharacterized membrane protein YfhO